MEFAIPNLSLICICISDFFKTECKTGFSGHNDYFNLCGYVDNSQWLLCSRKTGI